MAAEHRSTTGSIPDQYPRQRQEGYMRPPTEHHWNRCWSQREPTPYLEHPTGKAPHGWVRSAPLMSIALPQTLPHLNRHTIVFHIPKQSIQCLMPGRGWAHRHPSTTPSRHTAVSHSPILHRDRASPLSTPSLHTHPRAANRMHSIHTALVPRPQTLSSSQQQ